MQRPHQKRHGSAEGTEVASTLMRSGGMSGCGWGGGAKREVTRKLMARRFRSQFAAQEKLREIAILSAAQY